MAVKIAGFDNYSITNNGVIVNMRTGRTLKVGHNQNGYCQVQLCSDGKAKTCSIHKLVYQAFKGNTGIFEINHIDGNKNNNHISNLELVTKRENMIKAVINGQIKSGYESPLSVPISQIDVITGKEIKRFGSIRIAEKETGVASSAISSVINKNRITAGGFKWERI